MKIFYLFLTFIWHLDERIRAVYVVATIATSGFNRLAEIAAVVSAAFISLAVVAPTQSHAQLTFIPFSERQVLVELYNGAGGANWTNKTNWVDASGQLNPYGTECFWYGVTCVTFGNATGYVIEIVLPRNNLQGVLPATLSQFTLLRSFDANTNKLTGQIPSIAGLSQLTSFNVEFNTLAGPIPALNALPALQSLLLRSNQLTGTIPALNDLPALQFINLSQNRLSGSLPPLAGLTQLRSFGAFLNQLTGAIPPLTNLPNLENFAVYTNQLTGSIPDLSSLPNLQSFYVDTNQLTGGLPSLDGKVNLRQFSAGSNQLTGSIPSPSQLPLLNFFNVSNNRLTGEMPYLSGLPNLRALRIERNRLTGPIRPISGFSLTASRSALCPNQLDITADPAWDAATGETPWSKGCTINQQIAGFTLASPVSPGTPPVTLAATGGGSGNPVVFATSSPASICTVAGAVVTYVGLGTCVLTANQAGNVRYEPAPTVSVTVSIETFVGERCSLDLDGNGAIQPQTDGVMWLRIMLGFRGDAVMQVALGSGATRSTWPQIQSFLFNHCGIR
jgi:hypothetical protein